MSEESEKKERTDAANRIKEKYIRMNNNEKDPDDLQLTNTILERDRQITKLEKEMLELRKQLIELQQRLKVYEPERYAPPDYMGYQKDWSGVRKIIFILKRNFQALTSSQIMQELLDLEPFYKMMWNDPANCVSSLLSRACKNNLIVKISTPGMGAPVYKVIRRK